MGPTSGDHDWVGERAVELLVEHGYGPEEELSGSSLDEIREMEAEFDVELPAAYRSAMLRVGKHANGFLRGSEFTYPAPLYQREFAEKTVDSWECITFELRPSEFVFHGLQGYAFRVFDTEAGENPPVYFFVDGENEQLEAESFSEWLFEEIRN